MSGDCIYIVNKKTSNLSTRIFLKKVATAGLQSSKSKYRFNSDMPHFFIYIALAASATL
jgi:hypothetical protein